MLILLPALLAAAAAAQDAVPACVTAAPDYYLVRVANPAENFRVLTEPKRFRETCGAGAVVTNGTFFAPGAALGDVISGGVAVRSPGGADRRFKSGERWIDLGLRWGVGVLKGSRRLVVSDGDAALGAMEEFLGGGGLLLENGEDATTRNDAVPGRWGASFPRAGILDDRRGRVALGVASADGNQVLLLLKTKDSAGASVSALARLMKSFGATDAVFYDGGGAQGYAMGGRCLILPKNKGEDLNPTHIAIKACR